MTFLEQIDMGKKLTRIILLRLVPALLLTLMAVLAILRPVEAG